MTQPGPARLLAALEATWPPAQVVRLGGWVLRDGAGGGKRVSAASADAPGAEIAVAEAAMRTQGQRVLFRLGPDDEALDGTLAARGYRLLDPSLIYLARAAALARAPGPVRLFPLWPPLAIMRDIWPEGGIGPGRLAVMERAAGPKTAFLARVDDRAAGVGFCALAGNIAMLHAVEVLPPHRRKGLGALMLRGAAHWAAGAGAEWLALAVTKANGPARALYEANGMTIAAWYHYREENRDDQDRDSP